MYEAFYGLRERPFNLTPDPKFLYLSEKHKEAFAHLLYGIKNRSGFVMLSGEIGTGKTTICRNLLNQLDSDTKVAFIFNPALNPIELMKKINQEFGVDASANTLLELVDALNHYLLESATRGINNVLVIDESQNLEPEVLEQIRLLSNLETETEKLLQIILIGQPELAEKLSLHRLRQLNQRITARYHLHALNETETMQYIAYRLHVAGGRRKVRFAKGAVSRIHKISGGTPRVINALCDRCLLIGYTQETHMITPAIVKQAAKEIKGEKIELMGDKKGRFESLRPWLPSPGLALTAIIIVLALQLFIRPLQELNFQIASLNSAMPTTEKQPPRVDEDVRPGSPNPTGGDSVSGAPQLAPASSTLASKAEDRYKYTSLTVEAARRPDKPAPGSALNALQPDAALKAAGAALLRAWNLAPVNGFPTADNETALVAFAKGNGLDAEPLSPNLAQLRRINLPAFVRLDMDGREFWSAIVRTKENEVELSGEMGQLVQVADAEFTRIYARRAIILWQDPEPVTRVMTLGQDSPAIGEFKKHLRELGRISAGNTSSLYDQETAAAVAQIQAETGLSVDSKAGRQVRMVLMSWHTESTTPKLGKIKTAVATAPVRITPLERVPTPLSTAPETPAATQPARVAPQTQPYTPPPAMFGATPRKRIPAPSPYAPKPEQLVVAPAEEMAEEQPQEIKLDLLETVLISAPLDATTATAQDAEAEEPTE